MRHLIFISVILSLWGLLIGYDTTGIVYAFADVSKHDFYFSINQLNILVSWVLTWIVIGTLLTSKFTNKFGYRKVLFLAGFLFIFSTICLSITNTTSQFFCFSFILSLAIGVIFYAVPTYIVEISSKRLRIFLLILFLVCIILGVIAAFAYNLQVLHIQGKSLFASGAVVAVILFICTFFISESPKWLIFYGRDSEAIISLIKVYGINYHVPFAEIKSSVIRKKQLLIK